MTDEEARRLRQRHADLMRGNGEMAETIDRLEAVMAVQPGPVTWLLLRFLRWLQPHFQEAEEEARIAARATYKAPNLRW